MSLTAHLRALSTPRPYAAAAEHSFLAAAGNLRLTGARLGLWLAQDRIYAASAYPRFVALLIAKIPLDAPANAQDDANATALDKKNNLVLKALVDALQNVVREVQFFDDVASRFGIEIGEVGGRGKIWRERKGTRDYTAEMARIASLGTLDDGLVFLWAMEQVYLDAWKYVSSLLPAPTQPDSDLTASAIRSLTYNWTNPDFVKFVDQLGDIINSHFAALTGNESAASLAHAEQIWARVIELEEAFWPDEGEELISRINF